MYLYFESICIYWLERLTDVLDLMLVLVAMVAISKIPVATLGGLTREACNLSVLTPYHPDRNGIPQFEECFF